jgi:hypothetical protein
MRQRLALFSIVIALAATGLVSAKRSYLSDWQALYPDSQTDDNVTGGTGKSCSLCHVDSTGGGSWNGYGWSVRQEWEANGGDISGAFLAVETLDGDNDPGNNDNLDEINADTQPGWTDGPNNTHYFSDGSTLTGQEPFPGILGSMDPGGEPVCTDDDADTYAAEGGDCGPVDCDDTDSAVYPGAVEICDNGVDDDCDGLVDCVDDGCSIAPACTLNCTDADEDGYSVEGGDCGPVDCNDSDAAVNPGANEVCDNGVDDDCDGLVDCADGNCDADAACLTCTDADGDTYNVEGGGCGPVDCDDADPAVNPGTVEVCNNGVDDDCDGNVDCDDADCNDDPGCPTCVREGKGQTCSDGVDNDCDGDLDCDDADCANSKACAGGGGGDEGGSEGKGPTCGDLVDNDGDGLIDCGDPDCARNRACR